MSISSLISVIVIGSAVGLLSRVVAPGSRAVPVVFQMIVGIVAAFVGLFVVSILGLTYATNGMGWLAFVAPIVVAMIGVLAVSAIVTRSRIPRSTASGPPPPDRLRQDPPGRSAGSAATPRSIPERRRAAPEPPPAPTRIFLSYRRVDTPHAARGIAERLRQQFGRTEVFMDVDSLPIGSDFVQGVMEAIRSSAVVLVLIGDEWLGVADERNQRRLDDPDDNVRIEIEQALRHRCAVVPVLVDRATMPRADQLPNPLAPLHRLNAIRVDHVTWDADVARLVDVVDGLRPPVRGA